MPQLLSSVSEIVVKNSKMFLEAFARPPHLGLRLGQLVQQFVFHLK